MPYKNGSILNEECTDKLKQMETKAYDLQHIYCSLPGSIKERLMEKFEYDHSLIILISELTTTMHDILVDYGIEPMY